MKQSEKNRVVALAKEELFIARCSDDPILGKFLYDQFKAVLSVVGDFSEYERHWDLQAFNYVDRKDVEAVYLVDQQTERVLREFFLHRFSGVLNEYAKRKRKEGTEVLFALNSGELSLKDFENEFGKNNQS